MENWNRTEEDCTNIPKGYTTRKSGACHFIVDEETGEQVSPRFHGIHFPRAKLGASTYKLVKSGEYFVPKGELPNTMTDNVEKGIRLNESERAILERYKERSNRSVVSKISNKMKSVQQEVLPTNQENSNEGDNTSTEDGNEEKKENAEDDETTVAGSQNYWIIVSARIVGVLEEETEDWYILTSYDDVSRKKISSIQSFEDAMSVEHPYDMTTEVTEKLRKAEQTTEQFKAEKQVLMQDLMEEEYSL